MIDTYTLLVGQIPVKIRVSKKRGEFVPTYDVSLPNIGNGTRAILNYIKKDIITDIDIGPEEFVNPVKIKKIKETFFKKIFEKLKKILVFSREAELNILSEIVVQEMFGLGSIEFLINDKFLEEIVINNSKENIWVYHKKHGWLKTSVKLSDEDEIYNYSSKIARESGKEITILNPLLDAHLITGDRVNATIPPISPAGNTITIRKFSRKPLTVTDLIISKTLTLEAAALLWLAVENEISIIISGGTASGKTSFMTAILAFIPPNQRIISIEDTREIALPDFLHWVALTTRTKNPEGKGEVNMLDLLVNSLRMRPDRIIVGEIRRQKEAEVLFEAMHTGHSVYATIHADTAEQTLKRLTNPPINLPAQQVQTLPLVAVMYRHRRKRIRRLFELGEVLRAREGTGEINVNILYAWDAYDDKIEKKNQSIRILKELTLHTGMDELEIKKDLIERIKVLSYLVEKNVNDINDFGKFIAKFYEDKQKVLKSVSKKRGIAKKAKKNKK